ncbi:PREDICTED: olfactory receptor 14A16-like [Odobenus rosmarus divergens]|uniref:Olfactory receptor 14A16-like n=1 Tax=Odobenus rosmarus divergens TaxID=9708 RepID=A0A9B0HF40_ODORO
MPEKLMNVTLITEFLLMGFPDDQVLQRLYASFFSLVYLAALMGNLLIIILTTIDQHLQTPMYFFLKNLSLIDICYISVTVPKSVMNSLTNSHSISFVGCASQVFLLVFFAGTEFALLLVMSYDRYAAICCPLHYEAIMNRGACVQMFTFMVASYVYIVSTVLRIPSSQGRFKTFSTCMPHLTVVTLFLSSGYIAYLGSASKSPSSLNLLMPVFYSLLPPSLNPVIYSLKNRDMKGALGKIFG